MNGTNTRRAAGFIPAGRTAGINPAARYLLAAALLTFVPAGTPADAPARNADPGGADDVQDILFFTEARPFVFRLHITVNGQPHGAIWAKQILKVFNYLDRDG